MVSPYVNLANLRIQRGDLEGAIAILLDGKGKVPDASQLTYALARCSAARGDSENAARYIAETRKTAPELAAQLSSIVSSDASSGRGSFSGGFGPYLWSDGN
jgi:Flp pilus assembly protein TadD